MPELPEVETVRRSLVPHLPGRTIERLEIRDRRVIVRPPPESYQSLCGQTFRQPDRHGKLLILPLDSSVLLVHLGMTGQVTFRDPARADTPFTRHPVTGLQRSLQHEVDPHTHVSLYFKDGTALHYRDIRKFGKWRLLASGELADCPELKGLGPDPLTDRFQFEPFFERLRRSQRALKASLLDQGVVAGIGNIYADEALFVAGVRPDLKGPRLTRPRAKRLYEAVIEVLRKGVEHGGTTFSDYRDAEGNPGTNQESLLAYGRYGQPCVRCGRALERSVVGQRTTSWCRTCQR